MAGRSHEDLDDRLQHRMLFFTDAVFAIVITLLVLELRPPEPHEALEGNKLFALALSFSIIAISWLRTWPPPGGWPSSTGRWRWSTWSSCSRSA